MGRKLTYWERQEREEKREKERRRRASKVAARRASAKTERERKLKNNIAAAEKEVKKYEQFYDSLVSLHLHSFGTANFKSKFSKEEKFSSNLKEPKKPTYKFKSKEFRFKESKELSRFSTQSSFDFNMYCKAENKSSFFLFVKLFGTEKKYEAYIDEKKEQYGKLKKKKDTQSKTHKENEEKRKTSEQKEYDDSVSAFEKELKSYQQKLADQKKKFTNEEKERIEWYNRVLNGDKKSMEEACEFMFPIEFSLDSDYEMLNPTDAMVGYKISDKENLLVCVNLPEELNFLPDKGIKITPSGKGISEFKISNKLRTEVADRVICSLAFGYLKSIFNIIKTINNASIEVGVNGVDPKTGGAADLIFLSMEVSRNALNSLKLSHIDVLHAIENFEHKYRSTNTKKNIEGSIDRDSLIWATDDDSNIKVSKRLSNIFRACFY